MNYGVWDPRPRDRRQRRDRAIGDTRPPRPHQAEYSGIVDARLLGALTDPHDLRKSPKGLDALRRYQGRPPKWWPIKPDVSCSWPLFLYYRYMKKIGQHTLGQEFCTLLGVIAGRWKKYLQLVSTPDSIRLEPAKYQDDFWRGRLKEVSAVSFVRIFEQGPAYMMFTHLHALTGKAPYTADQIDSDIRDWVSKNKSDGTPKDFDKEAVKTSMDRVFLTWYGGDQGRGHLSFFDYCNDYYRWGTQGGAKKTMVLGSAYRSKWAYAYGNSVNPDGTLKDHYDLYKKAVEDYGDTANVALKEEAQKTREIITTPMPSYLRQCYLLYKWGKPKVNSPISSSSWILNYEKNNPEWYGCLDGDRFDHCVPAWFILQLIDRLGDLDEECRTVADAEIEHLKQLIVVWGDKRYKWEAGCLSGWRMTSIIGTLASVCAATYIMEKTKTTGMLQYGALGDDLVFFSFSGSIEPEEMVRLYNEFGLLANLFKTTSGKVGEFLRKVVHSGGIQGYPALALRSIVYANPWISTYTYERETELSNTWMTFISRLIPHSVVRMDHSIYEEVVSDLKGNFGPGKWMEWMRTPISAGGGGCIEFMDHGDWMSLTHETSGTVESNILLTIPTSLGILKARTVMSKIPEFRPSNIVTAWLNARDLAGTEQSHGFNTFFHDVNITRTLFDWAQGRLSRSDLSARLRYGLPRAVKGMSRDDILKYILTPKSDESGYTSILHTKETASSVAQLTRFVTRGVQLSRRFLNARVVKPAATVYFLSAYKNVRLPLGTW